MIRKSLLLGFCMNFAVALGWAVEIGDTEADVVKELGRAHSRMSFGERTVVTYAKERVIYVDGRVIDFRSLIPEKGAKPTVVVSRRVPNEPKQPAAAEKMPEAKAAEVGEKKDAERAQEAAASEETSGAKGQEEGKEAGIPSEETGVEAEGEAEAVDGDAERSATAEHPEPELRSFAWMNGLLRLQAPAGYSEVVALPVDSGWTRANLPDHQLVNEEEAVTVTASLKSNPIYGRRSLLGFMYGYVDTLKGIDPGIEIRGSAIRRLNDSPWIEIDYISRSGPEETRGKTLISIAEHSGLFISIKSPSAGYAMKAGDIETLVESVVVGKSWKASATRHAELGLLTLADS